MNSANAAQQNGAISAQGRGVIVPAIRTSNVQEGPVQVPAVEQADVRLSEDRRFDAVRRAAQSFINDGYVVSDTTFTIYKDGSGQFVTRFTNLRDGSVTYIPEPEIVQLQARDNQSFVEINA